MALITKMLDIAVNDYDAGRIKLTDLISIFQEAIDNGDVLEEVNQLCVAGRILPLIDQGVLQTSKHIATFEAQMCEKLTTEARKRWN